MKTLWMLGSLFLSSLLITACDGVPRDFEITPQENNPDNTQQPQDELNSGNGQGASLTIPAQVTLSPINDHFYLLNGRVNIDVAWQKVSGENGHVWTVLLNNQQALPFLSLPSNLNPQQADSVALAVTQPGDYALHVKLCQKKAAETLCSLSLAQNFTVTIKSMDSEGDAVNDPGEQETEIEIETDNDKDKTESNDNDSITEHPEKEQPADDTANATQELTTKACPDGSEIHALQQDAGVARFGSVFSSTLYDPSDSTRHNQSHQPKQIKIKVTRNGAPVTNCEVLWVSENGEQDGWAFADTAVTNAQGEVAAWWTAGTGDRQVMLAKIKRQDGTVSDTYFTGSAYPHKTRSNSTHINWASPEWDHFSVDVTPITLPATTYYSAINFPGGYTGLQTDKIIFSVWDSNTIDAQIIDAGIATCSGFGGEGTGAKCYVPFQAKLNHQYKFEIQVSYPVSNRTDYTLYFTDESQGQRIKVAQLRYGQTSIPNGASGFVEDWWQTGESCLATKERSVYFSNVKYKKGNDAFTTIDRATPSAVYNQWHNEICSNYFFGEQDGKFLWSSGGKDRISRPLNLPNTGVNISRVVKIEQGTTQDSYVKLDNNIELETSLEHYSIYPSQKSDLAAALNRTTPIQDNGKKYHARAKWNINWHYLYEKKTSSCEVKELTVSLNTDIIMPELAANSVADQATQTTFNQYYQALLQHEEGHLDFGKMAANEILIQLQNIQPAKDCATLSESLNQKGQEIIVQHAKLDDEYDANTDHGRSQGAYIYDYL